jgi:hypothetical protein
MTMSDFFKGILTGAGIMLALVLAVLGFRFFNNRDRKIYEAMELQNEIQELREDYGNRDPADFLNVPGVWGAANSAKDEYYRKLDEILQRYGSNRTD